MKAKTTAIAAAAAGVLTLSLMPAAGAAPLAKGKTCGNDKGGGLEAVALTDDNRLLCLEVNNPGDTRNIGEVDGLAGDTELIGIDFSAEDENLYGVGNQGGIYEIDVKDGDAEKVSQMTIVPAGDAFGVDFNPTSNALRVISNTGQNLRVGMISNGTTVLDGGLKNPPPMGSMDAPVALGVTGAAYTNTDEVEEDRTGTTLFDIDTSADRVSIQAPANAGNLSPAGSLRRDVDADNGFDIYSKQKGNGEAKKNVAYAALSNGDRSTLYKVDVLDGSLKKIGNFKKKHGEIIGLTLPIDQD